jgi:very-short-patch-repair endonuclease
MTLSEKLLWKALRKPDGGFRRQVPIGRYIADFAHLGVRLIVEVDSGWHDLPEKQLHDVVRDAWFEGEGYRVLRVRDREVFADLERVLDRIFSLLPRGEKGRDEGARAALDVKGARGAPPPAPFLRPPAPTLTQPPPLEGEGFSPAFGEGEG